MLCSGCVETAYLFPGIGLGCIVSRANRLRDEAFIAAAEALASLVTNGEPPSGKQKLYQGATFAVIGAMHVHNTSSWSVYRASVLESQDSVVLCRAPCKGTDSSWLEGHQGHICKGSLCGGQEGI